MRKPEELSDAEIFEIDERAKAASPGPWRRPNLDVCHFDGVWTENKHQRGPYIVAKANAYINTAANEAFIAASREDVPRLSDEVKRLRARLRKAEGVVEAVTEFLETSITCTCRSRVERLLGAVVEYKSDVRAATPPLSPLPIDPKLLAELPPDE